MSQSVMAASVQLEDLQSRLKQSLSELGYSGKVAKLPAALVGNEKMTKFMSWLVDSLTSENHLTSAEIAKFEELKSSNSVLEGEVLDNALTQLDPHGNVAHHHSNDALSREVGQMKEEVTALKTQLQTLNSIRQKLTDHYATVVGERDELLQQKTESQRCYRTSMERGQEDNDKVNSALSELSSSVKEVCAFHRGEGVGHTQATPTFLSSIPQDDYHKAEDGYLAELTAYTKKQFQGIATLVESGPEEAGHFSEVDLGDSEQVLLRGVSEEQHQQHCQELARLQALYPLTEMQCINGQLSEQHALAACKSAEEELAAMEQCHEQSLDHEKLRHQLKINQERLSELRSQIQELGERQVPDLLQDMAALQVSRVLHGDYDLKIARQDYFTSKQDKVIDYLRCQQARQELLSMLYEVELRRHRETHRLLSASENQLATWKEEKEKRVQAMQNPALHPVTATKQTVDSRDKLAQSLCALLGVEPTSTAPLVTYASLHDAVKQLTQQLTTLQALLSAHSSELKQLLTDQQYLTSEFELALFGHSGEHVEKPALTLKEYEEEHSKLSMVVDSLEQNIKTLLKDFESKKKVLQADPLLETERKLFVHFFKNPGKLRQTVSELAHRIDALATASKIAPSSESV